MVINSRRHRCRPRRSKLMSGRIPGTIVVLLLLLLLQLLVVVVTLRPRGRGVPGGRARWPNQRQIVVGGRKE
jgi:hypothetical protein